MSAALKSQHSSPFSPQAQASAKVSQQAADAMRFQLASSGNTAFLQNFMQTAPKELQQAFLPLSEQQIHGIMQETLALFKRPAGLHDTAIQQQIAAAGLPVDRIVADYDAREKKLATMSGEYAAQVGAAVKYGFKTLAASFIGGIVTGVGTAYALHRHAPDTPRFERMLGSILAGIGGLLSVAFVAKSKAPFVPQSLDTSAMEHALTVDANFAGEILRMAAMHYAKGRAAEISPESAVTAHNLAPQQSWSARMEAQIASAANDVVRGR